MPARPDGLLKGAGMMAKQGCDEAAMFLTVLDNS